MSIPRGLTAEEAAAWARLASSVTPLEGKKVPPLDKNTPKVRKPITPARSVTPPIKTVPKPAPSRSSNSGLDGQWERKLQSGTISPDFTLDLHGHSLDSAYSRLMHGMDQARSMGARVVLLITGKSRPVDPADRGSRRGAIRAKILDWLAASSHGDAIAAVRRAHIRHGGDGALYLVLKKRGK
jgi:DNA-nicking Smr family endonuclease